MEELQIKEQEYISYINEHRRNVLAACMQYDVALCKALNISIHSLTANILEHDKSKFSEEEFNAYRNYFHPCSGEEKDEEAFNKAWEHHYSNNPHHPEYWYNQGKDMPPVYIAEMLLDWQAMKMKFGGNNYDYYMKTRDKKPFSENTRKILDVVVKEVFDNGASI